MSHRQVFFLQKLKLEVFFLVFFWTLSNMIPQVFRTVLSKLFMSVVFDVLYLKKMLHDLATGKFFLQKLELDVFGGLF